MVLLSILRPDVLGPEWGQKTGNRANIACAPYGLKYADTRFRAYLADCVQYLEHEPLLADQTYGAVM